jgi:alpha-beta hydrolase superfamily lysophospholipase
MTTAEPSCSDCEFSGSYALPASSLTAGKSAHGTVVLLHGLTASPTETRPLAGYLSEAGFNVYAPRLSGHTGSLDDLRITEKWEWILNVDQAITAAERQFGGPLFLAGESLGAILSLLGAIRWPDKISGLALFAPPLALESVFTEAVMLLASLLPDLLQNRLPTVPKRLRPENHLAQKREALNVHSIAAAGRMASIRRMVFRNLPRVTTPILILEDPYDHHLGPGAWDELLSKVSGPVDTVLVPGGEHELMLGHRLKTIADATITFFEGSIKG